MIEKASIYTMNTLNKSSEIWHTSGHLKARPVVGGAHNKNWNDHVSACLSPKTGFALAVKNKNDVEPIQDRELEHP